MRLIAFRLTRERPKGGRIYQPYFKLLGRFVSLAQLLPITNKYRSERRGATILRRGTVTSGT
jgi:hypothetical protein